MANRYRKTRHTKEARKGCKEVRAHQELDNIGGAALLEDGDFAQETDVVARVVLLQLLHCHLLIIVPLRLVDLLYNPRGILSALATPC